MNKYLKWYKPLGTARTCSVIYVSIRVECVTQCYEIMHGFERNVVEYIYDGSPNAGHSFLEGRKKGEKIS